MTPRAWAGCGQCGGTGVSFNPVYHTTGGGENVDIPCPTCARHFAGLDAAVAEAVAVERERCARVAIRWGEAVGHPASGDRLAAAIRATTKETPKEEGE